MNNCKSCGVELVYEQQIRTACDGTLYIDDFCPSCYDLYITNIDTLDWKEYAHESLTKSKVRHFSEEIE